MPFAFPQWKGFERAPEGHLLDQLVDLGRPMGIAYERGVGFAKGFHAHDRAMVVLPRGSCVVKVRTEGSRSPYEIDSASLLIVPTGLRHDDEGVTSIFDTVALYPSVALLDRVGFPIMTVLYLFAQFIVLTPVSKKINYVAYGLVSNSLYSLRLRARSSQGALSPWTESALGQTASMPNTPQETSQRKAPGFGRTP